MVLSEAEAEAQLVALRRQREALDRKITDLTLYLELGRRLTGGSPLPAGEPSAAASPPKTVSAPSPDPAEPGEDRAAPRIRADEGTLPGSRTGPPPVPREPGSAPPGDVARPVVREARAVHPAQPDTAPTDGALSEGVLARRYGRALIEAALAALDEAGRPLHASEILAVLTGRGFSLPGHDPVAALNTRLWKRSGPGGPLKRMGDAVYALAEPDEDGD